MVGGGFAGLAAAIHLQERRHEVLLLERRGVLGGRATSYRDAASGEDVDNGTHLMIAGYGATLDLVHRAGAEALLHVQDDLRIDYVDDQGPTALACPPPPCAPAPAGRTARPARALARAVATRCASAWPFASDGSPRA